MSNKRYFYLIIILIVPILTLFLIGCAPENKLVEQTVEGQAVEKIYFPARDIELVCPMPPGGGYDTQLRLLARLWEKYLPPGHSFYVNNIEGGGGAVAGHHAWRAVPDGHSIIQANYNPLIIAEVLYPDDIKFKMTEFEWIGQYVSLNFAFVARLDFPANNWEELVKYSQEQRLVGGTGGVGGDDHLCGILMNTLTELEIQFVNYPGSADVQGGLARGEVDFHPGGLHSALRAEEAGIGKPLFLLDYERSNLAPDIPSAVEFGMPKDVLDKIMETPFATQARALAVPPGTPEEIVLILRETFWEVTHDPEFIEFLHQSGLEPFQVRGEDFQQRVKQDYENLKLMRDELLEILE